MSTEAARSAVEARFFAAWVSSGTTTRTPIAVENVQQLLTRTDGSQSINKPPSGASWVRLTVREGEGKQKDLNTAPRIRIEGRIYLDIFVPRGTGTSAARTLADLAVPIFRRETFSGLQCRAEHLRELGDSDAWWGLQVSWPYSRDEIDS